MMKKLTALLLALTLLLGMTTAFAWSCPSCGSDNSGKFCPECGTKKPEDVICPSCGMNYGSNPTKFCTECGTKLTDAASSAATPVAAATPVPTATPAPAQAGPKIDYIREDDNGLVYVGWTAAEGEEVEVRYFPKLSDSWTEDLKAQGKLGYYKATETSGSCTLTKTVPGLDYWIGAFDAQGNGHYEAMASKLEFAADFTLLETSQYTRSLLRTEEESVEVTAFSLAQTELDSPEEPGATMALVYNNPGAERKLVGKVILLDENNKAFVLYTAYMTFKPNAEGEVIGWNFVSLQGAFELLRNVYGKVAEGQYILYLSLDAKMAAVHLFEVSAQGAAAATATPAPTSVPLTITGYVPRGDGTGELSWMGGTAPYTVVYGLRTSEDADQDLDAASDAGFLHVEDSELQATSTVMYELIPGEKYWLVVMDDQGNRAYSDIKTQTGAFTDFETELVVSSNPVDAGKSNVAANYWDGLHVGFVYNNPGEAREVYLQCVIDYGSGLKKVTESGKLVMQSGRNCLDLGSFDSLDAFMEEAAKDVGFKPENDVTLSMYVDGKLAGRAVIPAKVKAPAFEITGAEMQPNGSYLLTWTDNGSGPWTVYFVEHWSDSMEADAEDERSSALWRDASSITEPVHTLEHLVPGFSYWIEVRDSQGNSAITKIDVPVWKLPMETWIEAKPCIKEGEEYRTLKSFSAENVNQDACGLDIEFHYDSIPSQTTMHTQAVLILPNGVSFCTTAFEMNMYPDGCTYWDFWDLSWEFERVKKWNDGEILLGEYILEFYIEGQYAASAVFQVTQDGAASQSDDEFGVDIISVVENADGTATVTWTDANSNGPYEIDYVQKYSDDYTADCSTGTGWWYDTKEAAGFTYTLRHLVPGQPYWIAVYDADGMGQYTEYSPAAAQKFPEFTLKLRNQPKLRTDGKDVTVTQFSSAEIGANLAEHGLYLAIDYPQLARARDYRGVIAITSPDGSYVAENVYDEHYNSGSAGTTSWSFYSLDWYFGILKSSFGAVPVGTYTMTLYLDGENAASTTFKVTN